MSRYADIYLLVIICMILCFPVYAQAQKAQIKDIMIERSREHVLISAKITDCFKKKMESSIMAGLPVTFKIYVEMYQRRSGWFDKKISKVIIYHTITYDNVKKVYSVSSSRNKEPNLFQDLGKAKEAMADLSGIKVITIAELTPKKPYYLMIKARLDKVRLPLHMEYLFLFVSFWDFETGWYKKELIY